MIKHLLNAIWPIDPWVDVLAMHLHDHPYEFVARPFSEACGQGSGVLYFDEDPFFIQAVEGPNALFHISMSVWPSGNIVVTSRYEPNGYYLNWREKRMLRDAIEEFKRWTLAPMWKPSENLGDDAS